MEYKKCYKGFVYTCVFFYRYIIFYTSQPPTFLLRRYICCTNNCMQLYFPLQLDVDSYFLGQKCSSFYLFVPEAVFVTGVKTSVQFGEFIYEVREMFRSQLVYNIFTINYRQLVIIGSNLNLTLRFFFASTIIINNNLPLKICYKNIVKMLQTYHCS